jgi:hypothetical protein
MRGRRACSIELRVAGDLARLWRNQGKIAEAHDLLAPIYGWFTERSKGASCRADVNRSST